VIGFLQEKEGVLSSTRLAFILWVAAVLIVWVVVSVKALALQAIPESVIIVIFTLMTGKVIQKFGEGKNGKVNNG